MMCAFMTPVLKNDWEVYNSHKRSRTSSESSQRTMTPTNGRPQAKNIRKRALGESRSVSYHIGNTRSDADILVRKPPVRAYHLSTQNSRTASRASFSPNNSGIASPTKGGSKSVGHQRSLSLTKFHSKVMDKLRNVLHMKEQQDTDLNNPEGSPDDEQTQDLKNNLK